MSASKPPIGSHEQQQQQQQQQQKRGGCGIQNSAGPQESLQLDAARLALRTILFSGNNNTRVREQAKLQKALQLLQSFPSLAREVYHNNKHDDEGHFPSDYLPEASTTPLAYFTRQIQRILATMSALVVFSSHRNGDAAEGLLSMLQTVYDLYPQAIAVPNERGRVPLQEACLFLSVAIDHLQEPRLPVLEFLMDRHPRAARLPDNSGQYAFHYALQEWGEWIASSGAGGNRSRRCPAKQQIWYATLQQLLDLHPAVLTIPDFGGFLPLERALTMVLDDDDDVDDEGDTTSEHGWIEKDAYDDDRSILRMLLERSLPNVTSYGMPFHQDYVIAVDEDDGDDDNDAHNRNFRLRNWLPEPSVKITQVVAQAVSVLFPRLETFRALGERWTVKGMKALLQSLLSSKCTVQQLSLRLPRPLFEKTDQPEKGTPSPTCRVLLEQLLQQARCPGSSTALRNVSFYGQATPVSFYRENYQGIVGQDHGYDNPAFTVIRNGVVHHDHHPQHRLDELRLYHFRLGTDCRAGVSPFTLLQTLLFSPHAPRSIYLSNIVLEGGNSLHASSAAAEMTKRPQATFEELTIRCIQGEWIYDLLEDLAGAGPASPLRKLTIDSCRASSDNNRIHHCLVDPLVRMLKTSRLVSLAVRDLDHGNKDRYQQQVQHLKLTNALVHNSHLKEFVVKISSDINFLKRTQEQRLCQVKDKSSIGENMKAALVEILKTCNTTLEAVAIGVLEPCALQKINAAEQEQDLEIGQLTLLNRCGRNEARFLGTTRERFVELLGDVKAIDESIRKAAKMEIDLEVEHTCLYMLLREGLSVWCRCTSRSTSPHALGYDRHRRKRAKTQCR